MYNLAAKHGPASKWQEMLNMSTRYKQMPFTTRQTWLYAIITASNGGMLMFKEYPHCYQCFAWFIGVHTITLHRARNAVDSGVKNPTHGNKGRCKPRQKTTEARAWLRAHAIRCGDYLPHVAAIQLPEFSMEQLYSNYVYFMIKDCLNSLGRAPPVVSCRTFTQFFRDDNLVLTLRKFFKSCKNCDKLNAQKRMAPSEIELKEFRQLMRDHNGDQMGERDQYGDHITKSRNYPDVYMSVGMDDIDLGKTALPVVNAQTAVQQKLPKFSVHCTGVIVHGPNGYTKVFTWYDEYPHEANVVIECLLRTIEDYKKLNNCLPRKIYIQLDNARNNKCNAVVKMLALLVELGVFDKIKLCFLLVGHTHNDVDQFFSTFTQMITKYGWEIYTLDDLHHFLRNLQNQSVQVEHLEQVLNYTAWIEHMGIKPIKGVTNPALFRFRKFEDPQSDGLITLVHTRERMRLRKKNDAACFQPEAGLHLFDKDSIFSLPLEAQEVARRPIDVEHAKQGGFVYIFSLPWSVVQIMDISNIFDIQHASIGSEIIMSDCSISWQCVKLYISNIFDNQPVLWGPLSIGGFCRIFCPFYRSVGGLRIQDDQGADSMVV